MKKFIFILLFLAISIVSGASSFDTALTRSTDTNDGYMAATDFYTHEWAYDKIGIDPTVAWPTFTRAGAATNPETGASVATGVPRYVTGFDSNPTGAIVVEEGTTNLLTANQASGGDALGNATGFTAIGTGVAISYDTSQHKFGAGSIKVVTDGTVGIQGIYSSIAGVTGSLPYTYGVWVLGDSASSGKLVKAYLYDVTNSVYSVISFHLSTSWQFIPVTKTIGAGSVACWCEVRGESSQALTFWVDTQQLEQKAYPTSWQNPADGARYGEITKGPISAINLTTGSISCRIKLTTGNNGSVRHIFRSDQGSPWNYRYFSYSNGVLTYATYNGLTVLAINSAASFSSWLTDNAYHHIVLTWNNTTATIYADGVQVATGTVYNCPVDPSYFEIGCHMAGTNYLDGSFDDFQIFSRALTAAEVSTLAARTTEAPVDAYTTYKLRFNNSLEPGKDTRLVENWRYSGTDLIDISQTTGTIPTGILGNSSLYIGTTSIALNRASTSQALTGITSIDGSAAKWTTAINLAGNSVDGSSNVAFANKFIVQGTADTGLSGPQFLGALGTGILKNTTTTGVLTIAVAGDFPTLNQSTTGSAATLTIARAIYGNNFDGSAALTQIIASTYGGTGNGFTKFTGPTTAEKTFTLPDANATLLYSGGALGTPSSGTLTNCTFPTLNQNTTGSAASLSISGQTGLLLFTGLTSTNRIKTVRDAADTVLELGGSYTPTGTWNWGSAMVTWPTFNQNTTGTSSNITAYTINQNVGTGNSPSFTGMTVSGLGEGFAKLSTSGVLSSAAAIYSGTTGTVAINNNITVNLGLGGSEKFYIVSVFVNTGIVADGPQGAAASYWDIERDSSSANHNIIRFVNLTGSSKTFTYKVYEF